MAYTTIKKPSDYFNTKLYTGNGSTNAITGVGFQPDFVWLKSRVNTTTDHKLFDAVRQSPNFISSNLNIAEAATSYFSGFQSDGFTVTGNNGQYNSNTDTFASWNWLANGTGSANTDGSISSTVSANTTAGFSIVKWTGTGSNANIGHGLGVVPKMIIVKRLNNVEDWTVYHASLGNTNKIDLNNTGATSAVANIWNNTTPTSSLFYVGDHGRVNASGDTYVAYAFAEKTGYSKFGSYIGNGNADGTFVYTGFKPAWVMTKQTSGGNHWHIHDNKRNPFNVVGKNLKADSSNAEEDPAGGENSRDFLSNGFKFRNADHNNSNGQTYIYMAFAEEPLVGDNPATAR